MNVTLNPLKTILLTQLQFYVMYFVHTHVTFREGTQMCVTEYLNKSSYDILTQFFETGNTNFGIGFTTKLLLQS